MTKAILNLKEVSKLRYISMISTSRTLKGMDFMNKLKRIETVRHCQGY